jgi:hypothetical protein
MSQNQESVSHHGDGKSDARDVRLKYIRKTEQEVKMGFDITIFLSFRYIGYSNETD